MTKINRVKLHHKAYEAFRLIERGKHQTRAYRIKDIEAGFALLLLWNLIELLLKLARYNEKIKDEWPNQLDFINARWSVLARIKHLNLNAYNITFGTNEKSLRKLRDRIAHTGELIDAEISEVYWDHAVFVIDRLMESIPNRDTMLAKKRRSDAQLNRNR